MSTTNINIRTDSDVKKQAQELFAELGLDLTTAVNIFLRKSIRYGGLPFDVTMDIPNETTVKAINNSDNEEVYGPFHTIDELREALDA